MKTINAQGAFNLAEAIVDNAKRDFVNLKEGSRWHEDAKQFFLSDHFEALTGLNGEAILRELQAEYERKQKSKKGIRAVICIETQQRYASVKSAAQQHKSFIANIDRACRKGWMAAGFHWKYADEE